MKLCLKTFQGREPRWAFRLLSLCLVMELVTPALAEMPDFGQRGSDRVNDLASTKIVSGGSNADPVWHESLQSGWEASKRSGRPMLIFITSAQCSYCDAMKKNTLCDPTVRERLFRGFVPIRLRPDANNRVLSRIQVTTFPTTLVAHPRGKVLAHRIGYQPANRFHELLSEVAVTGPPAIDSGSSLR